MFEPVRMRRLSEEIAQQIKSAIVAGKLKPGDKLPPERQLMKQLGVSRVPLREALNSLEGMGLIEIRQGEGSFVRSVLNDRMADPINVILNENTERIFDLIEVREEIESWSAYFAAQRATSKEIENLERLIEEMKKSLDDEKASYKLDMDFHLAISQASHNSFQSHFMYTISDILSEYLRFFVVKTFGDHQIRERRLSQHCRIFEAIRDKNPEQARERMLEHFTYLDKVLKQMMDDGLLPAKK